MKRIWGIPIGDLAGIAAAIAAIANLALAIIAIYISLYVFGKQSDSDRNQSTILEASRQALVSAKDQLTSEQITLGKVKNDLDTESNALLTIKAQTSTEVARLRAANAALQDVVSAANAQYRSERGILRITNQQYALLAREHAAAVAQAAARPKLNFSIAYLSGEIRWVSSPKAVAEHQQIVFPIGPELNESFHLQMVNAGNATLLTPIIVITDFSHSLQLSGGSCESTLPHTLQCGGRDLPGGQGYFTSFSIAAPKASGVFPMHVQVTCSNPNVASSGFQETFYLRLPAAPPH